MWIFVIYNSNCVMEFQCKILSKSIINPTLGRMGFKEALRDVCLSSSSDTLQFQTMLLLLPHMRRMDLEESNLLKSVGYLNLHHNLLMHLPRCLPQDRLKNWKVEVKLTLEVCHILYKLTHIHNLTLLSPVLCWCYCSVINSSPNQYKNTDSIRVTSWNELKSKV